MERGADAEEEGVVADAEFDLLVADGDAVAPHRQLRRLRDRAPHRHLERERVAPVQRGRRL